MEHARKTAVIAVTEKGAELAAFISAEAGFDLFLPEESAAKHGAVPYKALKACFARLMDGSYKGIVAVMAQGIVTRMTAPHLKSKHVDPAVVTCDEVGRFAISSIAGHEGGANSLAHLVASITGAVPVITTATEANRTHIIGIGCRKGTSKAEIIHAVHGACALAGISVKDLRLAASAWVKKDEAGLLEAVKDLNIYVRFIPEHAYKNSLYRFTEHEAPMKHFGIPGVAEPSAVLAAVNPIIVLPRTVMGSVTVAIIKEGLNG
ncbi:cobalamin biosynthesis protein CbiG [Geovibrio thiophilus]|uniref:Cobalamin biosynthesis protein CbiG n=1 Tax=Geovibrio thiophilus TaxID=139438 RepID=A0A3R5YZN6_9BACT|nr:cobalamin biosynthesis protein [Geovibrio thiophilus]QAR33441.1 cobalamin biosynthesis protein CbiG [Geovibrio thiophilus]